MGCCCCCTWSGPQLVQVLLLADGGGEQGATLAQRLHVPRHLTALYGLHTGLCCCMWRSRVCRRGSCCRHCWGYSQWRVRSVLQADQWAVHDDWVVVAWGAATWDHLYDGSPPVLCSPSCGRWARWSTHSPSWACPAWRLQPTTPATPLSPTQGCPAQPPTCWLSPQSWPRGEGKPGQAGTWPCSSSPTLSTPASAAPAPRPTPPCGPRPSPPGPSWRGTSWPWRWARPHCLFSSPPCPHVPVDPRPVEQHGHHCAERVGPGAAVHRGAEPEVPCVALRDPLVLLLLHRGWQKAVQHHRDPQSNLRIYTKEDP